MIYSISQRHVWLFFLVLAAHTLHLHASPSLTSFQMIYEIKLRIDYLRDSGTSSMDSFDEVRIRKKGSACVLSLIKGKRLSKVMWFDKEMILSPEECATVWSLVDLRATGSFKPTVQQGKGERSLDYRCKLEIFWNSEKEKSKQSQTSLSTLYWDNEIHESEYSKIQTLVNKLQSLKRLLTPLPDIPTQKKTEDKRSMAFTESSTSIQRSGIKGHVSHPHGVPWDWMKVYPLTVIVLDKNLSKVTSVETNLNGDYQINLPPGSYTVCPKSCTDPFSRRGLKTAIVNAGVYTIIDLHYDSGIR